MSGQFESNYSMFNSQNNVRQLQRISYYRSGKQQLARRPENAIGYGVHRSGWSACVKAISEAELGIAIDDFIEQTFSAHNAYQYHHQPFVGFFHYPPDDDLPSFVSKSSSIRYDRMFATDAWRESVQNLRCGIAMTRHLASWLRGHLDVPIYEVKHPTCTMVSQWSAKRFLENPKLIQVGAFYRDTRAICNFGAALFRLRLLDLSYDWIGRWDQLIAEHIGPSTLPESVYHIGRVSDSDYDEYLSCSVVISRFLAASASNVVVECIARKTPLIVNRIPAIEEYLGVDYPLYYEFIERFPSELVERALAAHAYLKSLPCDWLSHNSFIADVKRIVNQ